jgi:hypothetical protein
MVETISRRVRDPERVAVSVFTYVVLFALLLRYLIDRESINHDVAMYLNTGQLLLHGKLPYVDFVDLNPPLIMYMSAVPAAIARVFGISPIVVCNVSVWVVVAASTLSIQALYRRWANWSLRTEALLLLGFLAVNAMVASTGDWGQRDQLFAVLYLPFFFLRLLDQERVRVPPVARGVVGAAAALGACLKPGFLVIAVVPEVYWALRHARRPLRTVETNAFIGVCVAYALHFFLLPASARDAFFTRWLPVIARDYGAYYVGWRDLIYRQWVLIFILLLVATVLFLHETTPARRPATFNELFVPLALLSGFALAYYYQQHKGWTYQVIPFQIFAAVASGIAIGVVLDQRASRDETTDRRTQSRLLAAILVVASLTIIVNEEARAFSVASHRPDGAGYSLIKEYSRPGDQVLIMSTGVGPAYPALVQLDREPGSRYLWMFPIALYEAKRAPSDWCLPYDRMSAKEQRFVSDVEHDIATRKPQLILVAHTCLACPPGFSLVRYLVSSGIQSTSLGAYTTQPVPGAYEVFTRR